MRNKIALSLNYQDKNFQINSLKNSYLSCTTNLNGSKSKITRKNLYYKKKIDSLAKSINFLIENQTFECENGINKDILNFTKINKRIIKNN